MNFLLLVVTLFFSNPSLYNASQATHSPSTTTAGPGKGKGNGAGNGEYIIFIDIIP
jgi:hypothetical protein